MHNRLTATSFDRQPRGNLYRTLTRLQLSVFSVRRLRSNRRLCGTGPYTIFDSGGIKIHACSAEIVLLHIEFFQKNVNSTMLKDLFENYRFKDLFKIVNKDTGITMTFF